MNILMLNGYTLQYTYQFQNLHLTRLINLRLIDKLINNSFIFPVGIFFNIITSIVCCCIAIPFIVWISITSVTKYLFSTFTCYYNLLVFVLFNSFSSDLLLIVILLVVVVIDKSSVYIYFCVTVLFYVCVSPTSVTY